jgi:hypothetical protein
VPRRSRPALCASCSPDVIHRARSGTASGPYAHCWGQSAQQPPQQRALPDPVPPGLETQAVGGQGPGGPAFPAQPTAIAGQPRNQPNHTRGWAAKASSVADSAGKVGAGTVGVVERGRGNRTSQQRVVSVERDPNRNVFPAPGNCAPGNLPQCFGLPHLLQPSPEPGALSAARGMPTSQTISDASIWDSDPPRHQHEPEDQPRPRVRRAARDGSRGEAVATRHAVGSRRMRRATAVVRAHTVRSANTGSRPDPESQPRRGCQPFL